MNLVYPLRLFLLAGLSFCSPNLPAQFARTSVPIQNPCDPKPFRHELATLFPQSTFAGTFRILAIQAYHDSMASICPVDLAVSWGPLLPKHQAEMIHVQQAQRHYAWAYFGSKWSEKDITRHSANFHLILPKGLLRDRLMLLQKGQHVRLTGRLVDVEHPLLAAPWKTSLTREDTGTGACEILWLESLELLPEPTEDNDA